MTKTKKTWSGGWLRLWSVLAAAAMALGLGSRAEAASSAFLDIQVAISGSLSITIDGVTYSTDTSLGSKNAKDITVLGSTHTVTNNSSALNEMWELSTVDISTEGAAVTKWNVAAATGSSSGGPSCTTAGCPGVNEYAMQALFVSSGAASGACAGNLANSGSDWDHGGSTVPASGAFAIYGNAGTVADATGDGGINNGTGGYFADDGLAATSGSTDGAPDAFSATPNGIVNAGNKRGICVRVIMPSAVGDVLTHTLQLQVTAANPS